MTDGQRALFRVVAFVVGGVALVLAGMRLLGTSDLSLVIPMLLFIASGGLLAMVSMSGNVEVTSGVQGGLLVQRAVPAAPEGQRPGADQFVRRNSQDHPRWHG